MMLSLVILSLLVSFPTLVTARKRLSRHTRAPVGQPTYVGASFNLSQYPPGPYVTANVSSEIVTIPDPPTPNLVDNHVNCPHLQPGLLDWHLASTWGGSPPTTGQNVTIPVNSKVLISSSVIGQVGYIIIPNSSALIIGENPNGISLDAQGLDVQGVLQAGSESCRIQTPITITLHNPRPIDAVTNPRPALYKGIAVAGTLHFHGKRYFRTWTRLAKTTSPGDNVLMLQHPVNWEPGQQLVLVTTALKDSPEWHQNEVLNIRAVHPSPPPGVGAIVYLTTNVTYTHLATTAYQAEVGLLSRKIVVQGAMDDSEPTDPDPLNCTGTRNIHGNFAQPCGNTSLTGFGAHIIMYGGGRGFVEGVELYRVGQTNVLGRYPMHFHVLGECPECYFRQSSVHRSYYRCISVHGTNSSLVSENVGYDITGFCYYLEDGVEENNTISFNLAAHIRNIGPDVPFGIGSETETYLQSPILTNPADTTASGFYITNVHNNIIGNAASGGWAGFAFPLLPNSVGVFRNSKFSPLSVTSLVIDGNTAHSAGWFWEHAGAFYFGGSLNYTSTDLLQYVPGLTQYVRRQTCNVNPCAGNSCQPCPESQIGSVRITNTKVFAVASTGVNSWSGRLDLANFEAHDVGAMVTIFSNGLSIDKGLCACRSGETLVMPPGGMANLLPGNGKFLYVSGQVHILTNVELRNCGYRSDLYNQYDNSTTRGCGDSAANGCKKDSYGFTFFAHSDHNIPELMIASKNITFTDCGRRYSLSTALDTAAGRSTNWLDTDGTFSGLGVPSIVGSGDVSPQAWWGVDNQVVYDPQGPLRFIKQTNGPQRGLGYLTLLWDGALQQQAGTTTCDLGNGKNCPFLGYLRHLGHKFSPFISGSSPGMPLTASGKFVGPVGGFGWLLTIDAGSPKTIQMRHMQVLPTNPMIISIPYPKGTNFTITSNAAGCAKVVGVYTCSAVFSPVASVDQVRNGLGNTYHVDANGVLTIRVIQTADNFVGRPNWFLPNLTDPGRDGFPYAIRRFEENGVLLPRLNTGASLTIKADCVSSDGVYCTVKPPSYDPDVCPPGYMQTAYDKCCATSGSPCVFADGSTA